MIVLHNIEDAKWNGVWDIDRGAAFRAVEIFGVAGSSANDRMKPGPCVYISTGGWQLQGRIASKIYALLHLILKTGTPKDTAGAIAVDIRQVDENKLRFFSKALRAYFVKGLWTKNNDCNPYAKHIAERKDIRTIGILNYDCTEIIHILSPVH